MRQEFTVEGLPFTVVTFFLTGREEIVSGDVVLSSIGGIRHQITGGGKHNFEYEGKTYEIQVKSNAMGTGKNVTAKVNNQAVPVEMLPAGFSISNWIVAFVVIPIASIVYYLYPYLTGARDGYRVGGAIGGVVGTIVWVLIGIFVLIKKKNK